MASYYETLLVDKVVEKDQSLLNSMWSKNEDNIKKLNEKWVGPKFLDFLWAL